MGIRLVDVVYAIMALTCFGLRLTALGSQDADLGSTGRCSTCKQKVTNQSFPITQTHQAGGITPVRPSLARNSAQE